MKRWTRGLPVAALVVTAALGGCGDSSPVAGALPPAGSSSGGTPPVVVPGNLVMKAETALPPGQSGFVSTDGQARGRASGMPGDYGAHLDDQRLLYWNFDAKPAALGSKPGTPTSPKAGVQVYRDSYGVPIVYASTVRDLWYGVGYSVAQDRLFLLDAVRRTANGTLAELTGCGAVPADLQQRVVGYTDAEYQAFFDKLSPDAKDAVLGYVDGANAWIAATATDPQKLPAEYGLLTAQPEPINFRDVLASGVYITRFVAAEGGSEFNNIKKLRLLQARFGAAGGKAAFEDLTWQNDDKAFTSVPSSTRFSNHPEPAEGRAAVFSRLADWAVALPDSIARGDGTGHSTAPAPCSQPSLPMAANASSGLAGAAARELAQAPARKKLARGQQVQQKIVVALNELRAYLHGGSYAFAIAPQRTRDGGTLMVSGPQLGYSYPLLLVEYEIHGAGYDARGSSVPILPVVGIGYTDHAAWGLTTGYSKTIDSFIETLCSTAQIAAGSCKANQYFHKGVWKDMSCRTETLNYRAASSGLPFGPPNLTSSKQICRTVHGPLVARDDARGMGRSLAYAMWMREIETIEGIRQWNKAKSFAEFDAAMKLVTWNENTTVATRDGHIAYYHPGLHHQRPAGTDQRLPIPGDGSLDFTGVLPFEATPQARDPAQGYLANWNNKPALGWLDGEGQGDTSRPGGPGQRATSITSRLAAASGLTFADLKTLDRQGGTTDPRALEYLPLLADFRQSADAQLSAAEKAALDLVLGWNREHYGPGISLTDAAAKDGPAATVFGELVLALRDELFAPLKADVIEPAVGSAPALTVYSIAARVGSHVFDQSVMDNLAVRTLRPAASALSNQRDWTGGRTRDAVVLAAVKTALSRLATTYNGGVALTVADLPKCTRTHPRSNICSLTDVIGPGSTTPTGECVTMPYQDRGSWVHRVGWEKP